MKLSKYQIEKINSLSPMKWQTNEQGVFNEPWGIPDNIKGLVVYMRYETGGVSGGSCWDDSDPQPYSRDCVEPAFEVLDLVIKEINPNITYLQFREIEKLVQTNEDTDYEYYGNCTDFKIKFIPLDLLIEKMESFK